MVTLTRANLQPPPNQIALKCPLCYQQFHLRYSNDEWHRVNTMLKLAERALRADHNKRHQQDSVDFDWNPLRESRDVEG
jgi:hypothetical protein